MPSDSGAIRRWLTDIQHHIHMAQGFVSGMSYEVFKDDNLRLYAVTRCLEIISEASRRLPDELKDRYPSIAWRDMAAAGNIYRHEYEDVAALRVWQTLTVSLPMLLEVIEREMPAFVEDQSAWVALTLNLPEELEKKLEKLAQDAGLSVKCYCLRVLLKHLLERASPEQRERWQQGVPATLRRNGCDDNGEL
jgi:uncharacterized protein with HEPN domain